MLKWNPNSRLVTGRAKKVKKTQGLFRSFSCLILIKMLYTLVWTLTVICRFCLADGDVGHHIFPLSPVIERGSTLRRFCSLGKKLYPYKNASHIIWTLNGDRIAKENYKIVNDSVSEVIIHNFTLREAHVKCYVDFPVEKQHLAHTEVKSGFPPQKPENISCINYQGQNITCSWTFERDTDTETNYSIFAKEDKQVFLKETRSSKNGLRSWNFQTGIFYPLFCIQLKLENPLGKAESECVSQNSSEILKVEPPPVKVETIPGMKKMLRVSWERETYRECQIRYKNMKQNDSEDAYDIIEDPQENPFNLTNLWGFTEYAVAIRCIVQGSKFWSEWSREQKGTTEEEAPSKEVDLWRILETCRPIGTRLVHLFWKQLKEDESLGIIKGYRVKYFIQSNHSFVYVNNTTDETITIELTGVAYVISVIAQNGAGDSPEAILRIPSCAEESKDHSRIDMLNASALNEQMTVEWKTLDSNVHSYVVEWYDVSEMDANKRSWQYVRNATKWSFQKGTFKQYKCYNISVYPVYQDYIKAPSSIRTYFKEGRPSDGPNAEVENVDKNEATIKWKEIEKTKTNGDIINYTIFYKPEGGEELGKTVNANVLQYRLKSLRANVRYTAHVMASTIAGGTNGSAVTFSTSQLSLVEIVLINVIAGMLMLCLLTFGLLWALKRHTLKRIFWPKIPHPKLPEMSQDNLEKPLKEPQSEDNTVIPEVISTLKVEDNDECQLLNLEYCLKQSNVTTEDAVSSCEVSCSEEHKAIQFLPQTVPSTGQHFRNQLLPALMIQRQPLQRSEESLLEHCQNSSSKDEETQDQTSMKEKTEFNPYLKNSIHTREFLVCENLSVPKKKDRKKEVVPIPICVSGGNGQQYVALDAVVLNER
ncbi:interleukin-31 receptor subunit alpha [Eublepharis macularius]|uniref:Interleukin-31 receptor subunit alpha n=1 Tax=Eublepharis macularius TaxID=481883 RepID=A0AA97L5Q8_EUBMA|nr:interleukin-31 receptor subunit alpha [Eublepharis macularius]